MGYQARPVYSHEGHQPPAVEYATAKPSVCSHQRGTISLSRIGAWAFRPTHCYSQAAPRALGRPLIGKGLAEDTFRW